MFACGVGVATRLEPPLDCSLRSVAGNCLPASSGPRGSLLLRQGPKAVSACHVPVSQTKPIVQMPVPGLLLASLTKPCRLVFLCVCPRVSIYVCACVYVYVCVCVCIRVLAVFCCLPARPLKYHLAAPRRLVWQVPADHHCNRSPSRGQQGPGTEELVFR